MDIPVGVQEDKIVLEIGSDFHLMKIEKEVNENIFEYLDEYNAMYYDSGRSALRALLKYIPSNRILLPEYICESVRDCFDTSEVCYYKINKDMKICWDDLLKKSKNNINILYLHFFNGYIDTSYDFKELKRIQKKHKFIVIEDTTHSIFTNRNLIGDYCVCSLRKWFPIPDGGVLYSLKSIPGFKDIKENKWFLSKYKAMQLKTKYLNGQKIDKAYFLNDFSECENRLDEQMGFYRLSRISREILEKIDIKEMVNIRCKNAEYLYNYFSKTRVETVAMGSEGQVPLFYTLLIENRNNIRKWLIENKIYCPVHWPLFRDIETSSNSIYINSHELSIPLDQRYSCFDMKYIVDVFQKWEEINA